MVIMRAECSACLCSCKLNNIKITDAKVTFFTPSFCEFVIQRASLKTSVSAKLHCATTRPALDEISSPVWYQRARQRDRQVNVAVNIGQRLQETSQESRSYSVWQDSQGGKQRGGDACRAALELEFNDMPANGQPPDNLGSLYDEK